MTLEEIKAEMARKPDADLLIEWIEAFTLLLRQQDSVMAGIGDAIRAYHEAIEAS